MKKKFILIYLLLSCNIFYLLPISRWNIFRILSLLSILFVLLNQKIILYSKSKFNLTIFLLVLLTMIETILSKINYNQSMKEIIGTSLYYYIILYFFILDYYKNDNTKLYIKKVFVYISIVVSILLISQMILYQTFHIKFLSIDFENRIRFGEVRLEVASYLVCIGIIISLSEILQNNIKRSNILSLIVGTIYIIYVSKTRGYLIALTICILSMIYFYKSGFISKIYTTVIVILVGAIIINLPIISKYNDLKENDYGSSITRQNAINFYVNQIRNKPLFGMGIINTVNKNDENYSIVRGPYGKFYRDDVGIIGFTNEFGILGLILFLNIMVISFNIIKINFKDKSIYDNIEKVGLFTFLIITTPTLIAMNAERIVYLPFILFMIENNSLGEST